MNQATLEQIGGGPSVGFVGTRIERGRRTGRKASRKMDGLFHDRGDAGRRLGEALALRQWETPLVIAIPRGGVRVGLEAARRLSAQLSILIVRKLPFPYNPESGYGAIAEDGSQYLIPGAERFLPLETRERVAKSQKWEVERRVKVLRGGRTFPNIVGRTAILVDDGIAMGSTTQAAVACCRNLGAGRVVVAAPVGSPRAEGDLKKVADEVVVLHDPSDFRTVASCYDKWYDVSDSEVLEDLRAAAAEGLLEV